MSVSKNKITIHGYIVRMNCIVWAYLLYFSVLDAQHPLLIRLPHSTSALKLNKNGPTSYVLGGRA